jgi:hypothetical protein
MKEKIGSLVFAETLSTLKKVKLIKKYSRQRTTYWSVVEPRMHGNIFETLFCVFFFSSLFSTSKVKFFYFT